MKEAILMPLLIPHPFCLTFSVLCVRVSACLCTFDITPARNEGSMNRHEKGKGGQQRILILAIFVILCALLACKECKENGSDGRETTEGKSAAKDRSAADMGTPACVCSAEKINRGSIIYSENGPDGKIGLSSLKTAKMLSAEEISQFRIGTEALIRSPFGELGHKPLRPISDPALVRRFDEAKRLILSLNPPCAWHWDRVKALVEKHGGRLVYDGDGAINPYDPERTANGKLHSISFFGYLRDREELESSREELALDMIRNATTVVFEKMIMEWAGYHMGHLLMAELTCEDYGFFKQHLEAMFLVWNAYRARQAMHGGKPIPDIELPSLERALRAFDRGDDEEFFIRTGIAAKEWNETNLKKKMRAAMKEVAGSKECNFPPRLDREHVGLEAFLLDIDDGTLNLLEKRMIAWFKKS
jgi:hypothetical protein